MDLKRALISGLLVVTVQPAFAQSARGREVDVDRLPIDLERIQRQVRQASTEREQRDGLNLRYQVEVFGRAPELRLFAPGENLTNGPVPYGAPTHQEMIDHVTPREFRSPVMDFNAFFRWLAEKAKQ
jgi:hypothetical protein